MIISIRFPSSFSSAFFSFFIYFFLSLFIYFYLHILLFSLKESPYVQTFSLSFFSLSLCPPFNPTLILFSPNKEMATGILRDCETYTIVQTTSDFFPVTWVVWLVFTADSSSDVETVCYSFFLHLTHSCFISPLLFPALRSCQHDLLSVLTLQPCPAFLTWCFETPSLAARNGKILFYYNLSTVDERQAVRI